MVEVHAEHQVAEDDQKLGRDQGDAHGEGELAPEDRPGCSGSRPRIQKFLPLSESIGKMNRLVKVERIRAVTARLKKADQVPPERALDVVAEAADVGEVNGEQAEEDEELRPTPPGLCRKVRRSLRIKKTDRWGPEEEEEAVKEGRRARTSPGASASMFVPPGRGCSPER